MVLGNAGLPNRKRMRHRVSIQTNKLPVDLMENLQFHKFIILTMILLFPHDSANREG